MTDRLRDILKRQDMALISYDDATWLISEVERLRAELDRLTTVYIVLQPFKRSINTETAKQRDMLNDASVSLHAELDRRTLKWQTGPIPEDGHYQIQNLDGHFWFEYKRQGYKFKEGCRWAGPIIISEES